MAPRKNQPTQAAGSVETCTTQWGCKGTPEACRGAHDLTDQINAFVNGDYHGIGKDGAKRLIRSKEATYLPFCLQQARLRQAVKEAEERVNQVK